MTETKKKRPARLEIYRPVENAAGALKGILQVWHGEAIAWSRETNFDAPGIRESLANDVQSFFDDVAEERIREVIDQARRTIDAGNAAEYGEVKVSAFRAQARSIIRTLSDKKGARWLVEHGGNRRQFFFDPDLSMPLLIGDRELERLIWKAFNLNPTEKITGYLTEEMRLYAEENGDPVQVRTHSYYDVMGNQLYIHTGAGKMLQCDGNTVKVVNNGSEGVLFDASHNYEPWEYSPEPDDILVPFIQSINFDESRAVSLHENRLVLLVWMIGLLFRSEQPDKPLVVFTGPPESGKTSATRQIGQYMLGPSFQVTSLNEEREDDFWAAVTSSPLLSFDNIDRYVKWLEDALARVATGARIQKKKLYTDNTMVSYEPDCSLMLTAFQPRFRRSDVAQRLIIFNLARRDDEVIEGLSDLEIFEKVRKERGHLLSQLVNHANATLKIDRGERRTSPIRMRSFWHVARRIGGSLGRQDEVEEALLSMKRAQSDFAGEEHPLVMALDAFLPLRNPVTMQHNFELAWRMATLNDALKTHYAINFKGKWPYDSAIGLGRAFERMADVVQGRYVVTTLPAGLGGKQFSIQPRLTDEE